MNALRTEDELRAALDALGEDAPSAVEVLPGSRSGTRRRRVTWLAPLAAAAVVAAVAVGLAQRGGGDATPHGTGGDPRDLVARTWKVLTIDDRTPGFLLPLKIEPNGRFFQSVGTCSGLEGQLSIARTELTVDRVKPSFGTCPARRGEAAQEARVTSAFRRILAGTISWSLHDSRLTLVKEGAPTVVYSHYGRAGDLRQWTFQGVGISLPAEWPKNAQHCGTATANTVIYPSIVEENCLALRPPRVTSVAFAPTPSIVQPIPDRIGEPSGIVIDGVEARLVTFDPKTGPYAGLHVLQIEFARRRVVVTIASPNESEAANLLLQIYLVHP